MRYIDIGIIDGTLWCDRNMGADSVVGHGSYMSYDETDGMDIPTAADYTRLFMACDRKYVENHGGTGVNGVLFTSRENGNELFFPACGYEANGKTYNFNVEGEYVTGTTLGEGQVGDFYFNRNFMVHDDAVPVQFGHSVRLVKHKKQIGK